MIVLVNLAVVLFLLNCTNFDLMLLTFLDDCISCICGRVIGYLHACSMIFVWLLLNIYAAYGVFFFIHLLQG